MMSKKINYFLLCLFVFVSCEDNALPKPFGNIRLEYPKPIYNKIETNCGYTFKISNHSFIEKRIANECWYNIIYPEMNAKIYITYFPIDENIDEIISDVEKLTYEHTIKATYIKRRTFNNNEKRLSATVFEVGGEAASNIQFHATDSTKHFISGSVYFNARPNSDSLAPAIEYLKNDVQKIVESIDWNN